MDGYRALLIGNSTFPADPQNLQDLHGPVKDVAVLGAALTDRETGLFDADHVRLIVERPAPKVLEEVEDFFFDARRNDELLLYYSGHGLLDERNQLYLAAANTRTDRLRSTAVSAADISEMLDSSAARTVVILLDCCHSGAFKGNIGAANLAGSGRFVLTSCRSGELANDADRRNGTSLFTQHLVDGLMGGVADYDGDGLIDVDEVYRYIHERLAASNRQIPQRRFDGSARTPALALRPLPALAAAPPSPAPPPPAPPPPAPPSPAPPPVGPAPAGPRTVPDTAAPAETTPRPTMRTWYKRADPLRRVVVIAALAITVLLGVALVPLILNVDVSSFVTCKKRQVQAFVKPHVENVPLRSVPPPEASRELPDHPAIKAFDSNPDTYWQAPPSAPADGLTTLRAEFAGTSTIRQIHFFPGLPKAENPNSQPTPKNVVLTFTNAKGEVVGKEERFVLETNVAKEDQLLKLPAKKRVDFVEVAILDVYDSQAGGNQVAISDVQFFGAPSHLSSETCRIE